MLKVPYVAKTETTTYLLPALVKGAAEYLDAGVREQEKGKKRGKARGAGLEGGWRAQGRGENGRVGTDWELAGRRKGGRAGRRAEEIRIHWEGMCWGTGHTVEGGGGEDRLRSVSVLTISRTDGKAGWNQR